VTDRNEISARYFAEARGIAVMDKTGRDVEELTGGNME
jgi:hypothetical protein